MKGLKHIFFCLLIIICKIASFSQNIILKGGLNISEIDENSSSLIDPLQGIHLGCNIEFEIFTKFNFETGLFINNKGYHSLNIIRSDGHNLKKEITASYYYLDVPITLKRMNRINTNSTQYFIFGYYVGIGLAGKMTETETTMGQIESVSTNVKWGDHFKPLDAGLRYGVGWEIDNVIVEINYNFGMLNIVPGSSGLFDGLFNSSKDTYIIKNMTLSFTFGYKFLQL